MFEKSWLAPAELLAMFMTGLNPVSAEPGEVCPTIPGGRYHSPAMISDNLSIPQHECVGLSVCPCTGGGV